MRSQLVSRVSLLAEAAAKDKSALGAGCSINMVLSTSVQAALLCIICQTFEGLPPRFDDCWQSAMLLCHQACIVFDSVPYTLRNDAPSESLDKVRQGYRQGCPVVCAATVHSCDSVQQTACRPYYIVVCDSSLATLQSVATNISNHHTLWKP